MRFDYLTDDSEKSLAPFFSPLMISLTFNSVLIMCAVLLLFWPRQDFYRFLSKNTVPLLSFQIFSAAAIILSYVGFRCGRGEIFKSDYYTDPGSERGTYEKERNFFQYTLVEFILHTLLLILPLLPLMAISSSISGIPPAVFTKSVCIVFTASLLCRLFAFMLYLLWGRSSSAGYLFVRVFAALFLFATFLWIPAVNPIRIIYGLNKGVQTIMDSFSMYMTSVGVAGLFFIVANHLLVSRYMKMEKAT